MTGQLKLRKAFSGLTVLGTLALMSAGTAIAGPAQASVTTLAGHQAPQVLHCAPCPCAHPCGQ
jgi:hypothetical protein